MKLYRVDVVRQAHVLVLAKDSDAAIELIEKKAEDIVDNAEVLTDCYRKATAYDIQHYGDGMNGLVHHEGDTSITVAEALEIQRQTEFREQQQLLFPFEKAKGS